MSTWPRYNQNMAMKVGIEELKEHLEQAIELGNQVAYALAHIQLDKLTPDTGDYGAVLVFSFYHRHLELAKGALALAKIKNTASLSLVARSILEGFASLLWAVLEPETRQERAKRWSAFVWAEEKRFLQTQQEQGKPINEQWEREVADWLKSYPDLRRLDAFSWKATREGKEVKVKAMFDSLKAGNAGPEVDLHSLYRALSPYQHWSPIASHIRYKADRYVIEADVNSLLSPLLLSFTCLTGVMQFTSVYFDLDIEKEVKSYSDEAMNSIIS